MPRPPIAGGRVLAVALMVLLAGVACGDPAPSAAGDAAGDGARDDATARAGATTAPPPGSRATAPPGPGPAPGGSAPAPTSATPTSITPPSTGAATTAVAAGPRTDPAFVATTAAMRRRVASTGGRGYLLVVRDGEVLHEEAFGGVTRSTSMGVASTAKWMTAALVMTLVDEGRLSLDDEVHRWIPELGDGDEQRITVRQLLNHTSGIRDKPCLWEVGASMAACVRTLASSPLEFTPGTKFSYGNASYHVAGYLVGVVLGVDFQTAFRQRIAEPLGFAGTSFGGVANPSPAAGATTTVEDTAHLLEMMQGEGMFRGRRILSAESAREIQKDQVVGYDTSRDYAVGITRIPTYGLGTWRDRVDADDRIVVVSGNGARGYYPWIDHEHGAYGVVAVDDQRGAEVAVPASRLVIDEALAATARVAAGG